MYQPQGAAPPAVPTAAPPAAPPKVHTKAPTGLPPGFPSTREKLREDYRTVASLRQLASTLPREWGVYTPRADSLVKNIQAKIINIIKEHVNGY
jgi:hypothetical protein